MVKIYLKDLKHFSKLQLITTIWYFNGIQNI